MRRLSRLSPASCLLLAALAAGCGRPKPPEGPPPQIAFPRVAGWELTAPRPLPGDGYSVAYNAEPKLAVTVYVYTRGLDRIPDDLAAPEVRLELTRAKEAIQEAKRMGMYGSVKEEESGESTLGGKEGRKALYARFLLQVGDQETSSEIYVLPYRNQFIKVRVTRAAKGPEAARAALDRLYAELGKLLAK